MRGTILRTIVSLNWSFDVAAANHTITWALAVLNPSMPVANQDPFANPNADWMYHRVLNDTLLTAPAGEVPVSAPGFRTLELDLRSRRRVTDIDQDYFLVGVATAGAAHVAGSVSALVRLF